MTNLKAFISKLVEDVNSLANWKQVGSRLGSNPGGTFLNPAGEKHYVKFYSNPNQARSEVASAALYHRSGLHTTSPSLMSSDGNVAVVSPWKDGMKEISSSEYKSPTPELTHQLAKHFHAAVLTKNWDAVGLENDNLMKSPEGNIHSVDLGGTLKFRAMGGPKPYDDGIGEHETLRDRSMNQWGHAAFGSLPHDVLRSTLSDITKSNTPDAVHADFKSSGLIDHDEHARAYLGRLANLRSLYKV